MFIDHGNFAHTAGVPNRPSWAAANFTAQVRPSAYSCSPCGEYLWRIPYCSCKRRGGPLDTHGSQLQPRVENLYCSCKL